MTEISGKIADLSSTYSFGTNGFIKRDLVILIDEIFPQYIMVEFSMAKCELLDNFKIGDKIKVEVNLRGRKWINPQGEVKYFNSITGWAIIP